ncbi:hypothetical protein LPB19_07950 [Marinobacter salinisoli]|uniref:Toxin CptA n=1 Tax=Marinobacter salinisoli TaxID=2769486 RepID=A0ABX7MYA5_9GAMM|nr:hypothetical protein [Marinobacter salinisoli]QSP96299.1 hypothetical protein LPB19_07950 [Marinobacter salinisoli]
MFSRIEIPLAPSVPAGIIASLPWLAISIFLLGVGATRYPWLVAGVPLTLAGAAVVFRKTGLLQGKSAVTSLLLEQGQLYAQLGCGQREPVSPSPASRLGPHLTLLKLSAKDSTVRSYSAILIGSNPCCQGNVPGNEYRRLRVWLRLGQQAPSS